ncbi:xanthine dehydrogenase family Fe-S subunit [Bradyrhizobium elkanii]|uniref:xanthine dehydrogenase family Fe-S subunit n=1 Tax=Bradyrhizobium elkanii TaxID=29448 RepID=UPI0008417577|nr:2Fe-2S iron-sulfur cluster-binding protein [Bradyrhizobium elkanii]ODM79631.1 hypothetical protein A6X20_24330 [Bradyrhizobium elkanii]ODM81440.1 hypothetical protein A6452_22100 [Bradyrhizobium elkanii]
MNTLVAELTVNGAPVKAIAEPRTQLCEILRETLNLTGTHVGCEQGVCGACTVLVDGKPQRSCVSYAGDCSGSSVITIEGFDEDPLMAELRDAFSRHHALQCGYCTPGMLVTARDIVLRLGEVAPGTIREELSGNLCRCTGYVGLVEAIEEVSKGRNPQQAVLIPAVKVAAARQTAPPVPSPAPARPVRSVPQGNVTQSDLRKGWSRIEQHLEIAVPPDQVWQKLKDIRDVSKCLPGAEITEVDGSALSGRMNVALGPMKVAFSGDGAVAFDEAARSGRMTGRGRDTGSGSSAEGEVEWRVEPAEKNADAASRILVVLSWRLSGRLAQFNRGGLVEDVIQRLASIFAANLEASIKDTPAPAGEIKSLGVLDLLWGVLVSRWRRWRGK